MVKYHKPLKRIFLNLTPFEIKIVPNFWDKRGTNCIGNLEFERSGLNNKLQISNARSLNTLKF